MESPTTTNQEESPSPTPDQKGDIVLPLATIPPVSSVLSDPVVAISPPPPRRQRSTAAQITADELTPAEREYLRSAGSRENNRYQTRLRHTTALMKADEALEKITQSYTLDYVSKHPETFPVEATRNRRIPTANQDELYDSSQRAGHTQRRQCDGYPRSRDMPR